MVLILVSILFSIYYNKPVLLNIIGKFTLGHFINLSYHINLI